MKDHGTTRVIDRPGRRRWNAGTLAKEMRMARRVAVARKRLDKEIDG